MEELIVNEEGEDQEKKLLDWMMSEEYSKSNLKKKLNIEKHAIIGGLDLPDGRGLKRKSSKIPKNNYAATMVSTAHRKIIGGGGAPSKTNWRRHGAAGARLYPQ